MWKEGAARSKVGREIENVVAFIKRGKDFATLDQVLSELEGRRAAVDHELSNLSGVREVRCDRRQLERDLVRKLDDWRARCSDRRCRRRGRFCGC